MILFLIKLFLRGISNEVKFLIDRAMNPRRRIWIAVGDSLTSNALMDNVCSRCQIVGKNLGTPSSRVSLNGIFSMSSPFRVRQVPRKFDFLTIMGGTNDWRGNVAVGTIGDLKQDTFLGGLSALVRMVRMKKSNARILIITPPYAEALEFAGGVNANGATNKLGLMLGDYVHAMRAFALHANVDVLDVFELCDFKSSLDQYYSHDDKIHFNDKGRLAIADQMERRFSDLIQNL